jgi:Multiubiquitin
MSESEKNTPRDLEERAKRLEHMAEHEKEITIFVNGTEYQVEKGKISYEGLLELIEAPPLPEGKRYLVQYSKGTKDKPTGTLIEGQSVELKNHMEFDVTPTNRS